MQNPDIEKLEALQDELKELRDLEKRIRTDLEDQRH